MLSRFDHAVVAVRDLGTGSQTFERLGFTVTPGGRHLLGGTENAIVRFGLDYVELISVYDRSLALKSARGAELVRYLQARSAGLLGFALASAGLEDDRDRIEAAGLPAPEPFAMERVRPDGSIFSWRLLVPWAVAWRRPWPFVIAWATPDAERMTLEPPGRHRNGATRVVGVSVTVKDRASAALIYERAMGLPALRPAASDTPAAVAAATHLGDFAIVLEHPAGQEVAADASTKADALARDGDGLYELRFEVPDLAATASLLQGNQVRFAEMPGRLVVDDADALEGRLVFVSDRAAG